MKWQNKQLFGLFPEISSSGRAGSKSQAWILIDEGLWPPHCLSFLHFLLTLICLLKKTPNTHAHMSHLMHLPRPEPSHPIQHTSMQPCKGKLRKDVQRELFLYFHFKAPPWLPPFWLTFQLQNWGMQPQSCTRQERMFCQYFHPKFEHSHSRRRDLCHDLSGVCTSSYLGKDFTFSIHALP